jgi:hypothetical protein
MLSKERTLVPKKYIWLEATSFDHFQLSDFHLFPRTSFKNKESPKSDDCFGN